MVDVNVTTQSKRSEEHVFKGQKPGKNKFVIDWKATNKLKNSIMEIMQYMQATNPPSNLLILQRENEPLVGLGC
jgi:hypothetical protein